MTRFSARSAMRQGFEPSCRIGEEVPLQQRTPYRLWRGGELHEPQANPWAA
jgi:hypothetical protein